eukprot:628675-Prymnesium_polylepis.2
MPSHAVGAPARGVVANTVAVAAGRKARGCPADLWCWADERECKFVVDLSLQRRAGEPNSAKGRDEAVVLGEVHGIEQQLCAVGMALQARKYQGRVAVGPDRVDVAALV